MKFHVLSIAILVLIVGAAVADARRDLLDKSSAPGQQKKNNGKKNNGKGNGKGNQGGKNSNPNAKFNRPASDWNCTPESPHPKCQHANANAAFNRGTFRDPTSDSSDWEEVIDNEIPPIPGPIVPSPNDDDTPTPTPDPTPDPPGDNSMTSAQRRRAESLTNIFEFSTVSPQYGYAEYLGDGRGITFGRCGFTTGTGDGLVVVREYTRRKAGNPLAKYLPALEAIDNAKSGESNDDITGLTGFIEAVKSVCTDSTFRGVQDWGHNQMYWEPSQRASDVLGLKYPLSRAQMFDAYFMHGENSPSDAFYPKSANGMAAWVNSKLGGSPASGVDEKQWISTYLARREAILASSGKVWGEASNRIDIYQWLQAAVVYNLDRTIKLSKSGCGADGVCAVSSSSVTVGPSVYGSFTIN